MSTIDVVATQVETCELCSAEARGLFVQMMPGKDGKPWWLCFRCWLDGVRPMAKNDVVKTAKVKASAPKKRKVG